MPLWKVKFRTSFRTLKDRERMIEAATAEDAIAIIRLRYPKSKEYGIRTAQIND